MVKKSAKSVNSKANEAPVQGLDEQTLNSRMQECPIAVVGMASIFANAKTLDQYWDNIYQAVNGITDVPAANWEIADYYSSDKKAADKTYCKRGGFLPEIDFDPMAFGLPPNIMELTDIAQLLSLVVARDVLEDAGIGEASGYDRDKVGITLGVGGGQKQISPLTSRLQGPVLEKVLKASGIEAADREVIIEKFKKAYISWEENSFPGMLGNVIAGRIANRFDFGGTNCVVDAACASSLSAIKLAISDLLEYRSEVMISGGVCCDNSPFMYMSFSKTPAFTSGEDIRPFDDESKGMMIGEGIGMLAFKRLEDAERDGDKIYAVLKGIGTSSDGRFKSIYAPRPDGQAKALKRAYDDAGFDPTTCGLIEAHGTGTKAGDAAEFAGLTKHFSADNEQTQHIALGSVKSQIGHAKAAAGAAGMIKAVLALHHKVLPPTINIDKPNENLNIEQSPLYLNTQTRPWMPREDGNPRRAGISSFGFGGTNFHMVVEEYQAKASGQYRLNHVPQAIVLHADTTEQLVSLCQNWQNKLTTDTDNQPFIFNQLVTEFKLQAVPEQNARLGFVALNAPDALKILANALSQFTKQAGKSQWSLPSGLTFRAQGIDAKGKLVALFPGQGSQYVNMGRTLACNFPTVIDSASAMDEVFLADGLPHLSNTTYPIPVFTEQANTAQEAELRLTQHAQPAIGALSVGLFNTFKNAGFAPDMIAGHSFGELTALWAAGVINEQDYLSLAKSRGQAMAAPAVKAGEQAIDNGKMSAVVASPEQVEAIVADIDGVTIANYNANNQVVIAGESAQVDLAAERLTAQKLKVVPLPVSAAFHTPLVAHAQKPFADAIDKVKFTKPSTALYANGTGKQHSAKAADIKKVLKNHILESVRFKDEVEAIYQDGGRIFVEFGPKNVLTRLVDNILQEKDDVHTIAINSNANKCADLQLRIASVQLCVLGVSLEDIDPYSAVKRPTQAPKKSPLTIKLTGASYKSDKTKKAFDDALNDGWKISQVEALASANQQLTAQPAEKTVEKVVEKIVEVERIVEKPVYLNADGTPFNGNIAAPTSTPNNNAFTNGDNQALVSRVEQSVAQIVEQQAQMMNIHQEFMQGPKQYSQTVESVLAKNADTELSESVANTLKMYHQFQTDTLKVHESYLNAQSTPSINASATQTIDTHVAQPSNVQSNKAPQQPLPSAQNQTQNNVQINAQQNEQASATNITQAPVRTQNTAQPVIVKQEVNLAHNTTSAAAIEQVMMSVVAEKTGYPEEMLELEMDMEADLGIDSIKRVEILGSVQDQVDNLPELNPEDLAELRTLGEIVAYISEKLGAPSHASNVTPVVSTNATTAVQPSIETPTLANANSQAIQQVMMSVVADKTGYPEEMLELEMDMEADLGIDSIKRVEILGAVQDQVDNLPELNPEDLAELRTLGEIVSHIQSKLGNNNTAVPTSAALATSMSAKSTTSNSSVTTSVAIVEQNINDVMMAVVADKTGYPQEMLELDMDMEADLGIDSIKRVEILGAVQDEVANLPELNPEDLAELRTLGEIVSYMNSQGQTTSFETVESVESVETVAVTPANSQPLNPSVAVDNLNVQTVMMSVVAEKTGYPQEMLEFEMDMEADLGIDSIKRVEILGGVQDQVDNLPELNPEDLAELRTLGEIVDYMQRQALAQTTVDVETSSAPVASTAVQSAQPANAINANVQQVMMSVVADKTGYPEDMLELSMDMEADLGIDSIKRVEILGGVQDQIADLPELNPEDLAELRTLAEIVAYMEAKSAASPTTAIPSVEPAIASVAANQDVSKVSESSFSSEQVQQVMMSVVADKTGYPEDMLELSMDMEADLGIDSIKRVEILGGVQDQIVDLPELNPEDLAELRTLGEIVDYMQQQGAANTTAEQPSTNDSSEIATTTASFDAQQVEQVMMSVVADKTGYPEDMLELSMDMEADLGIDSIKRVEILGGVQDQITGLPELNPEDLAELRTLGEIVDYMANVNGTAAQNNNSTVAAVISQTLEQVSEPNAPLSAPSAVVEPVALNSVTKLVNDSQANSEHSLVLVDDGSTGAVALANQLMQVGHQVKVLKPSWVVSQTKQKFSASAQVTELNALASSEQLQEDLEQQVATFFDTLQGKVKAIVSLQASNESVDATSVVYFADASKLSLTLNFVLAKHCKVKALASHQQRASFVIVTRQGGALGFASKSALTDLVQSGNAGLIKTLSHEWPQVFCRLIDLPKKLAGEKLANIVCDELVDADSDIKEVGHDLDNLVLGQRMTLRAKVTDSFSLARGKQVSSDSVFLVSGGAKGVTAQCVIELAKQTHAKFILLGRSEYQTEPNWAEGLMGAELNKAAMQQLIAQQEKPTPVKVNQLVRPIVASREIAQTLADIQATGGMAKYVACDVTNAQQLAQSVKPLEQELGKISGIIHGAGVLADKLIEQKTLSELEAVYSTKIAGLSAMLSCVDENELQHLALFSSAAGFYGNLGQSDYSIANEILNKTAYRFKSSHPNCQVLSFNWGPWDGGMVTPELKQMFDQRGVYIIPLDVGAKLFVNELTAEQNRCAQILVGNDLSKDRSNDTTESAAKTTEGDVKKPLVSRPVNNVFVQSMNADGKREIAFEKTLVAANNVFLNDHVIGDDAVLPTVCALTWIKQAASLACPELTISAIEDYKLFKGVVFEASNEPSSVTANFVVTAELLTSELLASQQLTSEQLVDEQHLATTLAQSAQVRLAVKIASLGSNSANNKQRMQFHYGATVVMTEKALVAASLSQRINEVLQTAQSSNTAINDLAIYQDGTLFHGASFQGIEAVLVNTQTSLVLQCRAPHVDSQHCGDFAISHDNIFANDLVYQSMLVWTKLNYQQGSLPSSTGKWISYRNIKAGENFRLVVDVIKHSARQLVADIYLVDDNQSVIAQVEQAKVTLGKNLTELFLTSSKRHQDDKLGAQG